MLRSILEAERALARLDEAAIALCPAPFERALDETLASARLDGAAVDLDHLLLAEADIALVPPSARRVTATAVALLHAARDAFSGRLSGPPAPHPPAAGLVAEAWAAVAAARSVLTGDTVGESPTQPSCPPLSASWFAALWQRLEDVPATTGTWRRVAAAVTEALASAEGIAGAMAAYDRLHAPDILPMPHGAVTGVPRAPFALARLATPFLLRQACGLRQPLPLVSPLLARLGPCDGATLLARLPDACAAERLRLDERAAARARRHRAAGARRSSRAGLVLEALDAVPVTTVAQVQALTGTTPRGALDIVHRLKAAGVLRPLTRRPRDQVFALEDL